MLLVQIPTVLPLEYDASRRAKALVVKEGLLAPYELLLTEVAELPPPVPPELAP